MSVRNPSSEALRGPSPSEPLLALLQRSPLHCCRPHMHALHALPHRNHPPFFPPVPSRIPPTAFSAFFFFLVGSSPRPARLSFVVLMLHDDDDACVAACTRFGVVVRWCAGGRCAGTEPSAEKRSARLGSLPASVLARTHKSKQTTATDSNNLRTHHYSATTLQPDSRTTGTVPPPPVHFTGHSNLSPVWSC